jgi:putative ABC transport system permease protein
MHQLLSILELSSILCLVSLAAVLTFRLAGFPDLSVDGVFALGSVVFAKCLLTGMGVPLAILAAMMAGALAGMVTSVISVRLKINPLLASVLVLTVLYSVNLRILGKANQPLYSFDSPCWLNSDYSAVFFAVFAVAVIGLLYVLFRTELGCAMRCTGTSPTFLSSVGRNPSFYKVVLVAVAGALVATSGCFLTVKYGFADVSIGTGTIIIGIASLIIGEKICGRRHLLMQVLAAPIGIFLYELAVGVALSAGVSPTDVKLATGVITIGLLALGRMEKDRLFAQNS